MSESVGNPLSPMPGGDPVNMPGDRGPAPGPRPMSAPRNIQQTIEGSHSQAKAMFDLTSKNLGKIDTVRKGLEKLAGKGDVVTMEDIVEEAGKMASRGIDPFMLAGILADAPQEGGGEALSGWLANHAQAAEQNEQQLLLAHQAAGQQLASSALHMMRGHAITQALMPQTGPGPEPGPNPLMAGGDSQDVR